MKKAISLILATILICACLSPVSFAINAPAFETRITEGGYTEGTSQETFTSITETTFTLITKCPAVTSLVGAVLQFSFDSQVLQVASAGFAGKTDLDGNSINNFQGTTVNGLVNDDTGKYAFALVSDKGVTKTTPADMIYITFNVIDTTKSSTDVSLFVKEFVTNDDDDTNDIQSGAGVTAETVTVGFNPDIGIGHSFGEWVGTPTATCITSGVETQTCELCGRTKTRNVPALGHDFLSEYTIDTAPTCTEKGSKSIHCTRCDIVMNVTGIPATGHSYGEWIIDTDSTCTAVGSQHKVCSACNDIITEEMPKKEHAYGEWIEDTAATCTDEGSHHRVCADCSFQDTEAIAKLPHTYTGEWTVDVAPECETAGSKSQHCTVCDYHNKVTEIAPTGHTPGKWITDKAATYTEKGSKHQICSVCSKTIKTQSIAIVKLPAPKLTSAANTSTGITVKWGKVTAATGYIIYRKAGSASSWTKLATVSGVSTVSYTDKSVKSGTVYKYTVRAINSVNSGYYNTTGISVKCLSMPKVTLANAAKAVTVKWNKIAGATGYIVYRKAGSAKSWTKVATISKNSTVTYTDKNVKSGTNYTYTVKAYYGKVYSAYNTKGVAIKFIAPTVLNSAVSGKTGITLKYTKVSAGTGYVIYRKSTGGYSKLATVSGNTKVTYLDKTAKKGVTYTYVVRAYNGKFMSANSNTKACKDKY